MAYRPTAADVLEADREAQRRQDPARLDGVREQASRARAAHDRRRFLPRLTDSIARGIEAALLHRCDPRYPTTPPARRWLDTPLREVAVDWLTMAGDAPARDHHRLAMAWLHRGGQRHQAWQPAINAPAPGGPEKDPPTPPRHRWRLWPSGVKGFAAGTAEVLARVVDRG